MNESAFSSRLLTRFFRFTTKTSTCWLWTGCLNRGYGKFTIRRRTIPAHRFSFEQFKSKIPDGLVIDHICQNPRCVNPDHLEAVTHRENLMRSDTFQARNAAKTHCPNGHPYALSNLFRRKDGSRICRECCRQLKERKRRSEGRKKRGPYCASVENIKVVQAFQNTDLVTRSKTSATGWSIEAVLP